MSSSSPTPAIAEDVESELNDKQKEIIKHLLQLAKDNGGEAYTRSKKIANEIGLTSREVGTNLNIARKSVNCVEVKKWGRSNSTTWKVIATTDPNDN